METILPASLDEAETSSPSAASVVPHLSTSFDEVGPTTPLAALVRHQTSPPPPAEARLRPPNFRSQTSLVATARPWAPSSHMSPVARPWQLPPSPHPTLAPSTIVDAAASAGRSLLSATSITDYLRAQQHQTFQAPAIGTHPAASLLQSYATQGFPADAGPDWPLASIKAGIKLGPHTSTLTPEATAFCRVELLERVARGFSIILSQDDALATFGTWLKISRLMLLKDFFHKGRLYFATEMFEPFFQNILLGMRGTRPCNVPSNGVHGT